VIHNLVNSIFKCHIKASLNKAFFSTIYCYKTEGLAAICKVIFLVLLEISWLATMPGCRVCLIVVSASDRSATKTRSSLLAMALFTPFKTHVRSTI
jgi:hypothetical protein